MPASASTPTHPRSTARATRSSQVSPAATVTSTPPHVGSSPSTSARTPVVATSTTVPSKPASATTTLLPPPSTRIGPSTVLIASTSSCSVVARTQAVAGPPSLSVVWSASRSPISGGTNDGLGHAEHLLPARGDGEHDRGQAVLGLLGLARDLDIDRALGRYDDRGGELAARARPPRRRGTSPRPLAPRAPWCTCHGRSRRAARRCGPPRRPGGSGCGRRWPRRTPRGPRG